MERLVNGRLKGAVLALVMLVCLLTLAACGGPKAVAVPGADIPAFSVILDLNGQTKTEITGDALQNITPYSVTTTTTNSYGTKETRTYVGYRISDVAATFTDDKNITGLFAEGSDGYRATYDAKIFRQPTTLLALTCDGNPDGGPWLAPCSSGDTPDYVKSLSVIGVMLG